MTQEQLQTIADTCREHGYNFALALRTAVRDGTPWYRTETPSQEFERRSAEAFAILSARQDLA